MKKLSLLGVCLVLPTILASPPASGAQTVTVACVNEATADQSRINRALNKLASGDTLMLTGRCRANLTGIPGGVIIAGGGNGACGETSGATIEAADAGQSTITLSSAENVTIRGLIIKGGVQGVLLTSVADGTIRDSNIRGNSGDGIAVNWQSHARIANNCIEDNGKDGIGVSSNSTARIGFISVNAPSPNTIKNNGRDGVHVARSSSARILCNNISDNKVSGITLHSSAQADVAANTIDRNGANGVNARESSGVNLGRLPFSSCSANFDDEANHTTSPNALFGINCFIQGYVTGKRGSLGSGPTSFVNGCLDMTTP